MHHPLPRRVRDAIAAIDQNVSHQTQWGMYSQTGYPGECRWFVTGGNDWPIQDFPSVTTTCNNAIEIVGVEEIKKAIEANDRAQAKADYADASLHNQAGALRQVLAVLVIAKVEALSEAINPVPA